MIAKIARPPPPPSDHPSTWHWETALYWLMSIFTGCGIHSSLTFTNINYKHLPRASKGGRQTAFSQCWSTQKPWNNSANFSLECGPTTNWRWLENAIVAAAGKNLKLWDRYQGAKILTLEKQSHVSSETVAALFHHKVHTTIVNTYREQWGRQGPDKMMYW